MRRAGRSGPLEKHPSSCSHADHCKMGYNSLYLVCHEMLNSGSAVGKALPLQGGQGKGDDLALPQQGEQHQCAKEMDGGIKEQSFSPPL